MEWVGLTVLDAVFVEIPPKQLTHEKMQTPAHEHSPDIGALCESSLGITPAFLLVPEAV